MTMIYMSDRDVTHLVPPGPFAQPLCGLVGAADRPLRRAGGPVTCTGCLTVAQAAFGWVLLHYPDDAQARVQGSAGLVVPIGRITPAGVRIGTPGTEYVTKDGDWLHCLCGNTPDMSGFTTCLADGIAVEPDVDGPWDGRLYLCQNCGRVIDQYTLAVTGRTTLPNGEH